MAVRVFKSRTFARWAKTEGLADTDLCRAAHEIAAGLIDAHLGGFLLKKRIARRHGGKSGGLRTIVAYRQGDRMFFIFGFAKNARDSIGDDERKALIKLGQQYMSFDDGKLAELMKGELISEVKQDG